MRFVLLILCLTAPHPAAAEEWELLSDRSSLHFTYTENGNARHGRFMQIEGRARFHPAFPDETDVEVNVDTGSVSLGDPIRSSFARSPAIFDTNTHPQARFTLNNLIDDGGERLRADGVLTLKGNAFPLSPEFLLVQIGDCLRATGQMEMRLSDYGIGDDRLSRFIVLGDSVTLTFTLIGRVAGAEDRCG